MNFQFWVNYSFNGPKTHFSLVKLFCYFKGSNITWTCVLTYCHVLINPNKHYGRYKYIYDDSDNLYDRRTGFIVTHARRHARSE